MNKAMLFGAILAAGTLCAAEAMAAGPCLHLRSEGECTSYPTGECFWDFDDLRCESHGCEDTCCPLDEGTCASWSGCFWDPDDRRCEIRQ